MAYMHKETFDIVQDSNIDGFLDDYFDVDDLIALPIQTLNRKGYTTTYCCSGHPFPVISEAIVKTDYETAKSIVPGLLSISEDEKGGCRVRFKQYLGRHSHISFDENVTLPEDMPAGWYWEDHTMYIDYCTDADAYILIEDLLYTMRELNRWADALPSRNK